MDDFSSCGFATRAIHAGIKHEKQYGCLATPIYQSSTFVFDTPEQGGRRFAGEEDGYIYTRLGNPTVSMLEDKIANLENAEAALACSSGMGAITTALWTILKSGDHIVADETLYGCTFAMLSHGLSRYEIDVTFVDMSNLDEIKNAITDKTRVVYFETPSNPNLKIVDIEAISSLTHSIRSDITVMVDNTFATPYLTRPIELGADVVLHSATKYINGHGDVIAGIIVGGRDYINQCRLFGLKDMTGAVMSPFDAFLILRGLKTLPIRMDKHCSNTHMVAEFLRGHSVVDKVYYPGFEEHKNHAVAAKQMKDFGGMISFELKGGKEEGIKLLNNVKLCKVAVSLGDAETLIQHPASMTHSTYNEEELENAGIAQGLIRLSVGLEDAEDIINDLKNALDMLI